MKDSDIDALIKILKYESIASEDDLRLGWSWDKVGVFTGTLNKLVVQGVLVIAYKSNSTTGYRLTDEGRKIAGEGMKTQDVQEIITNGDGVELTEFSMDMVNIFSDIIGHDDIKELLRESLCLEKPIHVLLCGPPSIAKTMFLWDLEKAGGSTAAWVLGSSTSKSGLQDLLANRQPRWLLIDELERMSYSDMSSLLSILEGGRIARTKVGRMLDQKIDVWAVATANRLNRIPGELISRFAVKKLQPYDAVSFMSVVRGVLTKREGLIEDDAQKVAFALVNKTQDIREAVRVARLSKRVGIDRAIELLLT